MGGTEYGMLKEEKVMQSPSGGGRGTVRGSVVKWMVGVEVVGNLERQKSEGDKVVGRAGHCSLEWLQRRFTGSCHCFLFGDNYR